MNKLRDYVIYSAALLAASANNPYFDVGQRPQYKPSINNPQVQRMADFNAHRTILREFSVHGVKIEARSKKDAIKIYNATKRKQKKL
jgi:hypothetical protein